MSITETELGQIGQKRPSKNGLEFITTPQELQCEVDVQLWREFGGRQELWRGGLYRGNIEDAQDREVVTRLIEANELVVACFGNVTYGIIGDGYSSGIQEKFRIAKNASKEKPLSALINPNSLPLIIDRKAVGSSYPILSDPIEFSQRFTSLAFVKAGISNSLISRYIALKCFRQEEIYSGNTYETANMLSFIGDGASGQLQEEVASVIARKHNRQVESVWIPVSSCNLSGRGADGKKTPDHFEIVHASAAEEFCRLSGIKAVLHSPNANQYRSASFEMWTVTPDGVYREREGNIRYGHARRLFNDIPLDQINARPTIKRNRQLVGRDAIITRILSDNSHSPREVGTLLRAYFSEGIDSTQVSTRRIQPVQLDS